MARKQKDFIGFKVAQLAALDDQEKGAISLVERTIKELRGISAQSKMVVDEIDAYIAEASEVRARAESRMNHSDAIASNFEKLITVDE